MNWYVTVLNAHVFFSDPDLMINLAIFKRESHVETITDPFLWADSILCLLKSDNLIILNIAKIFNIFEGDFLFLNYLTHLFKKFCLINQLFFDLLRYLKLTFIFYSNSDCLRYEYATDYSDLSHFLIISGGFLGLTFIILKNIYIHFPISLCSH
jgi:hypothetical protein